jgi:hypothetical protein
MVVRLNWVSLLLVVGGATFACSPHTGNSSEGAGGGTGTGAVAGTGMSAGTGGTPSTAGTSSAGAGGTSGAGTAGSSAGTAGSGASAGAAGNGGSAGAGTAGTAQGGTSADAGAAGEGSMPTIECRSNEDCSTSPHGRVCDEVAGLCVVCKSDGDCTHGKVCSSQHCVTGCDNDSDCPSGESCCASACVNLDDDAQHCGACDTSCKSAAHSDAVCVKGECDRTCSGTFADCDGDAKNGCEWDTDWGGPCLCTPGETTTCYDGPPGTAGVAACKAGTHTCGDTGVFWTPCAGQVTPVPEKCTNGKDDDCDGVIDNNPPDADGDGWTICDGDCCDTPDCSPSPALINPGAFDDPSDGVDNDCNGTIDDTLVTACSTAAKFSGVTGMDVAKAMDLCQTAEASPVATKKTWGVISVAQLHADGTEFTTPTEATDQQTAIKTGFGANVTPKKNATLAVLSTGMARDASDTGWVTPISGTSFSSGIVFPGAPPLSTFLAQHSDGLPPGKCNADVCATGVSANDSVGVRLVIRAPTNAKGFSYDFRFFTAEYYSYQCTQFNDYYLALLTSGASGIPADRNISFDSLKNPVSVNNGFFQDCGGNTLSCGTCPFGTASLNGTGFDSVNGGATEWLTTDAPVVPGETFTLDLTIFDVGDHSYDSLVLLDNFRWSLDAVQVGTHQ